MFGITLLEFIHVITSVLSAGMMILCINQCFENIENSCIKLKNEKKILEAQIEELKTEKQLEYPYPEILPGNDVNSVLLRENLRLQVRCDMLTEIRKKRNECDTCFQKCKKCIKNL